MMTEERTLYLLRKLESGDNSISGAGPEALATLAEWDELEVEGYIRVARIENHMSAAGGLYKATATLTESGRDVLRGAERRRKQF
jgi:hypothetical protein